MATRTKHLNPKARMAAKSAARRREARELRAGRVTEGELRERNAVRWDGVTAELPQLMFDRCALLNLRLHEIVAARLVSEPALIEQARMRLRRLRAVNSAVALHYARWSRLLNGPSRVLLRKLTERSEEADAMRKASPFAVFVTEEERRRALEETSAVRRHARGT